MFRAQFASVQLAIPVVVALLLLGSALSSMVQAQAPVAAQPTIENASPANEVLVGKNDKGEPYKIDTGDTAWMLTSSALVLMMTGPGLALFYGGLVRRKNVLATMMQSFILMAAVSVVWAII